jgi:hypothetical protein
MKEHRSLKLEFIRQENSRMEVQRGSLKPYSRKHLDIHKLGIAKEKKSNKEEG